MKYSILFLFFCVAVTQTAKAQTTVSGTVKDDKGNPLHFVFIEDGHKLATFSDSLGNFSIPVYPDSKLKFELQGYESTSVNADKSSNSLQVVLKSVGGGNSASGLTAQRTSGDTSMQRPNDVDFMRLPGHQKGQLHGSRYLFVNFVHGFVITSSDVLFHAPSYLFDYDKLEGKLLYTNNMTDVNEVSWDQTRSFTLYDSHDQRMEFEKVPAIDNSHYVQVLGAGKKYKIYKLIKTKFVRADYVNNGVTSHGNDYDEYLDDADYYFFDVQGNQLKKISLKKKAIKEAFSKEADKVNKYLSDNSGDINDVYLNKLGEYMNQ